MSLPAVARLPLVTAAAPFCRVGIVAGDLVWPVQTSACGPMQLSIFLVGARLSVKGTADDCPGINGYHAELVTVVDYAH